MNHHLRIAALRAELKKKKIDAFLTVHLPNIRYLTGFSGSNALVYVTPERTLFLTDFRYKDQIAGEVTADEKIVGQGPLIAVAAKKRLFGRSGTIGYEKKHLSIGQFEEFTGAIGAKKLAATEDIVEDLRGVKDNAETALIAKAVDITDTVFQKILGVIKPGVRESDVSAEISYLHKKLGAEKDAFDTIVASGVRGALPHGAASGKKIQAGEFVTLDFGCVVNGYHSDMTRTVCIGRLSAEMKAVYGIVFDAQRKGTDAVADGAAANEVDAAARGFIAKKGYGKYFGHSLGHGVGLEIHEQLRLASSNKKRLKSGQVVTVEPGIYLPGKFGVRIEDMTVVRRNGCEILTASPKELIVL